MSLKKKVAIVSERIAPFYHGGAEEVMYNYIEILEKQYDVYVFTSFDLGVASTKLGKVKFYYISSSIKKSNKKGNHSLKSILSFSVGTFLHRHFIVDFDLVILDSIHYFYPKLFLKFIRRKNRKIITLFHEAWYEYRKSNAVSPLISYIMGISIRRLISYSDTIISVSDSTTKSLIDNYNVTKEKVVTIPLGINHKNMNNTFSYRIIPRRRFDLLFVGRFAAIKRVCDIVESVSIFAKKGKKLEVALIGDGPQKEIIERKIKDLGLKKNFHLFGFINNNEKYSIMSDSKIFVLPSEREGFSLSTLEAMTFGCIPIVSKPKFDEVFGVSHFVKNGLNGLYYSVGNVDDLAKSIAKCLDNLDIAETLSSNAIETSKKYTIDKMAMSIYDITKKIMY